MPRPSRLRSCPALSREITPSDCAAHRLVEYSCPGECGHHPFGTSRYSDFLQLEASLDGKIGRRLARDPVQGRVLLHELQALEGAESEDRLEAVAIRMTYFDRAPDGRNVVDRWVQDGLPELSTDEAVLLRGRNQVRPALLEIHRVFDEETWDAIDLLDPESGPMVFKDRATASVALRFLTLFTWIYPAPFYWRTHGSAVDVTAACDLDPAETTGEIIRHRGGPAREDGLRDWLARNFLHVQDALVAVHAARARAMFDSMDMEWCRAEYSFVGSAVEVTSALRSLEELEPEMLTPEDRRKGIRGAAAWIDRGEDGSAGDGAIEDGATEDGRTVEESLGRVVFTAEGCHLETMGSARLLRLRKRFEARLNGVVRFRKETREDMRGRLNLPLQPYDASLVPPSLLERPQTASMSVSRIAVPPETGSMEQAEVELFRHLDREWLDSPLPALDGSTPRQAAALPGLRQALLSLLKSRVRHGDERWRKTGVEQDSNRMLRELGATEILFEPPATLANAGMRGRTQRPGFRTD